MRGIANLGNTCSISSFLQCIVNSEHVKNHFESVTYTGTSTNLHDLLAHIVSLYHDVAIGGTLVPTAFIRELYKAVGYLQHGQQHDVCEIWMIICNAIAEASFDRTILCKHAIDNDTLNNVSTRNHAYAQMLLHSSNTLVQQNKTTASRWLEMFQGMFICQTQCPMCEHISHTFEPFTVINVDITDHVLTSCLENSLKNETIDGWECDNCKVVSTTTKSIRFWKLPKVLCMSLKRFNYSDGVVHKNRSRIDVPHTFSISRQSVIGDRHNNPDEFKLYKFTLCGTAIHHGSADGGHYTAVCMDPQGNMFDCDDEHVTHINNNTNSTSQAYFIMYDAATGSDFQ